LYFAENQWVKTTLEDSKTQRNLIDNVLSTLLLSFSIKNSTFRKQNILLTRKNILYKEILKKHTDFHD